MYSHNIGDEYNDFKDDQQAHFDLLQLIGQSSLHVFAHDSFIDSRHATTYGPITPARVRIP
jgi:hypothetical protein